MDLRVLDHVKSASTYVDGQAIFDLIMPVVKSGECVRVNFDGITSVPSAFVNSAFVQLLEHISFEKIRSNLTFVKSTRQINDLIRSRFDFVVSQGSHDARTRQDVK